MRTPIRKQGIKRLARKSYKSLATMMLESLDSLKSTVTGMAHKILAEMKQLSSDSHDSIIRDDVEAVKNFHWETVMIEYKKMIPTLILLLECLVDKPEERKPFICFVASFLLKSRHQRMGLVQRVISTMLYGNGCTKHVST